MLYTSRGGSYRPQMLKPVGPNYADERRLRGILSRYGETPSVRELNRMAIRSNSRHVRAERHGRLAGKVLLGFSLFTMLSLLAAGSASACVLWDSEKTYDVVESHMGNGPDGKWYTPDDRVVLRTRYGETFSVGRSVYGNLDKLHDELMGGGQVDLKYDCNHRVTEIKSMTPSWVIKQEKEKREAANEDYELDMRTADVPIAMLAGAALLGLSTRKKFGE